MLQSIYHISLARLQPYKKVEVISISVHVNLILRHKACILEVHLHSSRVVLEKVFDHGTLTFHPLEYVTVNKKGNVILVPQFHPKELHLSKCLY